MRFLSLLWGKVARMDGLKSGVFVIRTKVHCGVHKGKKKEDGGGVGGSGEKRGGYILALPPGSHYCQCVEMLAL